MKFKYFNQDFYGGGFLIGSLLAANVFNFVFNAFLGRTLTLSQFSVLTLVNTLWFFLSIFINSVASTTNNRTAYLAAKRGNRVAHGFRAFIIKRNIAISLVLVFGWISLVPLLEALFHTNNLFLFVTLAPAIILGIFAAGVRGHLQGIFSFKRAAMMIFIEGFSKLLYSFIFVSSGLNSYVYLSIPLSILTVFLLALFFYITKKEKKVSYRYIFPKKLLFATFLTVISSTAFLSVDLLLARHFLTPSTSGEYSLLSLVGKMIYFIGSLLSVFILTLASRDIGLNKNSNVNFYKILAVNISLSFGAFIALGIFGNEFVPVLFGEKSKLIISYLLPYSYGILLFTIASAFATYHLARQQFIFAYNGVFTTIVAVVGMLLWHKNIHDFVAVIIVASFTYLATNIILHVFYKDISEYFDEEDKNKLSRFQNILLDKIAVSICIPAYNESKNIGKLLDALLKQETEHVNINRIVIVSSASTDETDDIVRKIMKFDQKKMLLVRQKERHGKAAAINSFLKRVDDPVVVVQSADTLPKKDTIEKLCRPFLVDGNIGMTGGAPYPVNDPTTFLGFVVHSWWWFHRHIPRFGEIIAFRNILDEVSPRAIVDEAYIQAKFIQLGYKVVQINDAIVYNKGAENVKDILIQRRRNFNGHMKLIEEEKIKIVHVSKSELKLLVFDFKLYHPIQLIWLIGGVAIEIWAMVLGYYDKYVGHANPALWRMAKSTKDLSIQTGRGQQ